MRVLALVISAMLCASIGCQTRPMKIYVAPPGQYSVIVAERGDIQDIWDSYPNHKIQQVYGFTDRVLMIHFVQYGYSNEPDFSVLGHEYFHQPHLGDDFHPNE